MTIRISIATWALGVVAPSAASAQTPPDSAAPPAPDPPGPVEPLPDPAAPRLVYVGRAAEPSMAPAEPARPLRDRGIWLRGSFGVGAPFGASTFVALSEGPSLNLSAGWTWPNFGAAAYFQYAATSIQSRGMDGSGQLFLGGVEARGILGADAPLKGWLGLGLALGGGALENTTDDARYEANFGLSPSLSLGAALRLFGGLRVGPEARWYLLSISRACETHQVLGEDVRRCEDDPATEVAPDLVYFGIGVSWTGTS